MLIIYAKLQTQRMKFMFNIAAINWCR